MVANHNDASERRTTRRTTLKAVGALSVTGFAGVTSAAAARSDSVVRRVRGSYGSPLSVDETEAELEKLVDKTAQADESVLGDRSVPTFGGDQEIVEYVARIDGTGHLSQYFGSTAKEQEKDAHEHADAKEAAFEEADDVTIDVTQGPDWNFIQDNQAHLSDHWGELNHNFEWYRIRESAEERNAFRSKVASSDDTINPYARDILVEHDWGVSDLGSESIHEADPSSISSGSTTVGIGFPPSATLSWTFDGDGSVEQSLYNSGPRVEWDNNISRNGTHWFEPGSHVVSDAADCTNDQDVIEMTATTRWGAVYEFEHTWNIETVTC